MKKMIAMVLGLMLVANVGLGQIVVSTNAPVVTQGLVDRYNALPEAERNAMVFVDAYRKVVTNSLNTVNTVKMIDLWENTAPTNYANATLTENLVLVNWSAMLTYHRDMVVKYVNSIPSSRPDALFGVYVLHANNTKANIFAERQLTVKDFELMISYLLTRETDTADVVFLRRLRSSMNSTALLKYVTLRARAAGRPTVGVTLPEYQAIIDAQNTGIGMKAALEAVELVYPEYWDAGIADAKARVAKIMSGEQLVATTKDIAVIETFLGVDGLKKFTEAYNKL